MGKFPSPNCETCQTDILSQDPSQIDRSMSIDPSWAAGGRQRATWRDRLRPGQTVVKAWHVVFAMVGLGFFLRLPLLSLGLWRDEAATILNIQGETIAEFFNNILIYENSPPGFFLLMGLWVRCFGTHDWVVKLPALAIGLLLIPAVYVLGETVRSRKTGLMAAAFVTLAQPTVFYAQEIRPYGLVALLVTCAMVFYVRLVAAGGVGRWHWMALVLSLTGAMYVQYTGILFGVSLGLVTIGAWLYQRRRGKAFAIGKFALAGAVILGLYGPWLMACASQMQDGLSYIGGHPWNHALTLSERPWRVLLNILYALTPGLSTNLWGSLALILALVVFAHFKPAERSEPPVAGNLGLILLMGSLVIMAAIEGALGMGGRYMFLMMPIGWVLLSQGLWWLVPRLQRIKIQGWSLGPWRLWLGCFLLIAALGSTLDYIGEDKSGLRPLMADLDRGIYPAVESTTYLAIPDVLGITASYYQGQASQPTVRNIAFHGFPHWDHPERHVPREYYKAWMNPQAVEETLQKISQQKGDRYLGLLYSPSISQLLQPQCRKTVEMMVDRLKQNYPILVQRQYAAKNVRRHDLTEEFTFYLFDLGGR
jgi:4-amino-4-deoxy-L-arabinose transferase-like glycosyltransferase